MRKYEEAAKALVEELEAWYTASQDPQRELLKRIAELERERDEFRDSLRFCHEQASLLAQDVARADRLAEAIRDYIYRGHVGMENVKNALAAYEAGEPVAHPDTEREPSEVEMLRALDRSATRKRLDLESEIRELRKAEEWVRLIRMLASEYSGNMKLSKAIDRADAAFRSFSPQPADLCPRHDLGHEFSPCTGTPDDPCLAAPSPQPTATHFACPQRHLDYEREGE